MTRKNPTAWWSNSEPTAPPQAHGRTRWVRKVLSGFVTGASVAVLLATGTVSAVGMGDWVTTQRTGSITAVAPSITAIMHECGSIFNFSQDPNVKYTGTFSPQEVTPQKNGAILTPVPQVIIPPYGHMSETGLDQENRIHDQDEVVPLEQTLRTMYDGGTIIWYDIALVGKPGFARIASWVNSQPNAHLIMWKNPNTGLPSSKSIRAMPEGRLIGLSTWGVTQSCMKWSEDAASEFRASAAQIRLDMELPPAPKKSPLTGEGKLHPLNLKP